MGKLANRLVKALIISIAVLFYGFTFFSILDIGLDAQERARITAVGKTVPGSFPVLVVSQESPGDHYTARIVYKWALTDYLRKTPNWSFTVPEGKEAELNKQLASQIAGIWQAWGTDCPFGAGGFEVKRLANGKQQFLVDGSWDDDRINRGWYTADCRHFYPDRYVEYFGPTLCMMYAPLGLLVISVIFVIDNIIRRRLRKRTTDPAENIRVCRIALALSLACLFSFVAFLVFGPNNHSVRLAMMIGIWGLAAATKIVSLWIVRL